MEVAYFTLSYKQLYAIRQIIGGPKAILPPSYKITVKLYMYFVGLHKGQYILLSFYMLNVMFNINRALDVEENSIAHVIPCIKISTREIYNLI